MGETSHERIRRFEVSTHPDCGVYGRAAEFLELSRAVDRFSQVTFVPPMEGYIRRMLWVLVHAGVIGCESAQDPFGPELPESEFVELGNTLRELGEL